MIHRWLAGLRRRKVLRVASAYVVAAWGVLQGVEALAPLLALPSWTLPMVALLMLAGLPVTVAAVWALQPAAPRPEAATRAGAVDLALLAAAGVVVVLAGLQLLLRPASSPAPAPAAAPASVAVLPFVSFSGAPEDGYFSDGLTEELINSLARVPGLLVTGRTSSFHFKGRDEDLRAIGRQLGVGHLVEGSVRRAGARLRVTVQLVSAEDGFHLWSQTYERDLDDSFAIQRDIAEQVARTLRTTLLVESAGPDRQAPALYPDLLVARALLNERTLPSVTEARTLFARMVEAEPDHVAALAGLARATMLLAGAYLTLDFEPAARSAVEAVERAVRLAPDDVAANLSAGIVYDTLALRTDESGYLALAMRHLARAADLAPENPEVLRSYAALLARQGRWPVAVTLCERAVARDPLDRAGRLQLAEVLRGSGRLADARRELEDLLQAHPDYTAAHLELGELFMESGALDAAIVPLQRAHAARTSPRASFALANVYLNLGLTEELERTLAELDYAPRSAPLAQMIRLHAAGDGAAALAHAEAQLALTGDRIWRPLVALEALATGALDTARQQLRSLDPELLGPAPPVDRVPAGTVLMAATLLQAEGEGARAATLLEQLLQVLAPTPGGYDPIAGKLARSQALALLGRNDQALAELEDARRQGYRTLYDFDNFLRLDRYPSFAGLRGEPRFLALLQAIEHDNRTLGRTVRAG